MSYIYLIFFSCLLAIGQVLFKKAALESNMAGGLFGFVNLWFISALIVYGLTTLLWVWILKTVPLSIAYPFSALGFVIVPVAAIWLFGEPISGKYIVGAALIVLGVFVVSGTR